MFRWLMAVVVGISLCCLSSEIRADDRESAAGARDGVRESRRDEAKRKKRERRERQKRNQEEERKRREEKANQQQSDKPAEKQPEAQPPRDTPKPEPKPEPKSEPKPSEPLPTPADNVEAKGQNTEPNAQPDIDFALQGEYMGELSSGPLAGRVGLQVVALGDGNFDAYLLQGGLPGNGWLRGSPRPKLSGQRDGANATLRGDAGSVSIDGETATIADNNGHALGQLRKVLRRSPTMGAAPAVGATVLFDGKSTAAFQTAKVTEEGLLGVGALTKEPVSDFRLHLEFRTPFEPHKRGQGRGNSGVYIQERYEVQVLDSFGLEGEFQECGGLYRQRKPDYNLCLPPMSWQTYDIHFTSARFDAQGNKTANARITVFHNGIAVHHDVELTGKTGAGQKEEPKPRPIRLQDHGNAVVYRNIWIAPRQESPPQGSCCEP